MAQPDKDTKEYINYHFNNIMRNPSDVEAVRVELRRRAQRDFWFFSYHCAGWKDIDNPLHHEMCARFVKRAKRRFTLWLIPRSHLKTSLWSVSGILWEAVQDHLWLPNGGQIRGQDQRAALINAKMENAVDIVRDIKNIVSFNPMFGFLFPEYVPTDGYMRGKGKGKWLDERIDFPCSKQAGRKEGNLEVFSAGSSKTSKHYDLLQFDDPVNEENTTTKQYRDRMFKWYRDTLQLRDNPLTSKVRIIGTRWHYDDLYGRIIAAETKRREQQKQEGRRVEPLYYIYRRKAIEMDSPIWPERFTIEELTDLKAQLGGYIYSCQYDNDPVPEEDATFRRSDINIIDSLELPEDLTYFTAVDLADEETTRGDFSVITTAGIDAAGKMYVVEVQRGHFKLNEVLQRIYGAVRKYGSSRVGVEVTGFQKAILRNYKHEADMNGWFIPWREMKRGKTSKFQRILSLQPLVERGDFHIVEDIKNADEAIEELCTFPYGVNDDILDTLTDIQHIYFTTNETPALPIDDTVTWDKVHGSLYAEPELQIDEYHSYLSSKWLQ